jgi:hypothetical protein
MPNDLILRLGTFLSSVLWNSSGINIYDFHAQPEHIFWVSTFLLLSCSRLDLYIKNRISLDSELTKWDNLLWL